MRSLDERRVLNNAPWKLREGIAELGDSLHLHPEARFLGHRGIETSRVSVFAVSDEGRELTHSKQSEGEYRGRCRPGC